MKNLYKNTRRVAATIVAMMVLSVGTAVAVTQAGDASVSAQQPAADSVGRFVVTPKAVKFIPPAETVGRFVVSRHNAVFLPAAHDDAQRTA